MSDKSAGEVVSSAESPNPEVLTPAGERADSEVAGDFSKFPISDPLRQALEAMKYFTPTQVQAAVIEPAVAGRDLLVQSKTGSGKTSAFGIPLLEKIAAGSGVPGGPKGLILLPTRELAHQVAEELSKLAKFTKTRILAIYGGVPMSRQINALTRGVDIAVGTPGRLLDLIRRQNLTLEGVEMVVLDEADEMLSMGFWDDVTELVKATKASRQMLFFSATLPYEVVKSASTFLSDPIRLDLSGDNLSVDGIDNCILHIAPNIPKPRQLLYVLEGAHADSAIIFCNTRNETELLAKYLTQSGFVAEPLSGSFKQKDRERVMSRIKGGELRYMVATDIAARGIDINDLSHVVNYSLPEFCEVYLHRVGRTGRHGKVGRAISLVDGKGLGTLSVLEKQFQIKFNEMTLPPEDEVMRTRSLRIMKDLLEKSQVAELSQHLPVAQDIIGSSEAPQVVAYLLKSYFQAQADSGRRSEAASPAASTRRPTSEEGEENPRAATEDDEEGGMDADGRKRRRRRRGRGRTPERAAAEGFDVVDAADLLSGNLPPASAPAPVRAPTPAPAPRQAARPVSDGLSRIRVNVGFDDGFKGRGAVAKRISALAGLNEGIVMEVESRRDFAILKATPELAELVIDRVDGAQLGKKVLNLTLVE